MDFGSEMIEKEKLIYRCHLHDGIGVYKALKIL